MTRRMYRYEIPLDDQSHIVSVDGRIRHVATRWDGDRPFVEFWAEHLDTVRVPERQFQVFGTGHPVPSDAQWAGTCDRDPHGLVWHLYERWAT